MKTVTSCTRDCPDACSLLAEIAPDGSIRIEGNPDHPVTARVTCKKTQEYRSEPASILHGYSMGSKGISALGIDNGKIAAGGGSAGGHVAAAVATVDGFEDLGHSVQATPDALVLFNPVYDNGPEGYGNSRVTDNLAGIVDVHGVPCPLVVDVSSVRQLYSTTLTYYFGRK